MPELIDNQRSNAMKRFSAGDRVYCLKTGVGTIYKVFEGTSGLAINLGCAIGVLNMSDAMHECCIAATVENYELLRKQHPDVFFDHPDFPVIGAHPKRQPVSFQKAGKEMDDLMEIIRLYQILNIRFIPIPVVSDEQSLILQKMFFDAVSGGDDA